ncbi:MAG: hypothetical protein KTR33_15975 [Gammaproteobacteria bacterium]|nr:hypothetical protein [Gammaproteobacteria bacterium]
MDWTGYKPCCYRAALDAGAAFCGECRCPLLRCVSFAECSQLVEPTKHCAVCLSPELIIEAGAAVDARVGERFSIPLLLHNQSTASHRPMWVMRMFKREPGAEIQQLAQDWNSVEAGEERQFFLDAGPFDAGGTIRLDVLLEIATRSKEGFQEGYLFGGTLLVTVTSESSQQIVQKIDLTNANIGTGGLINTDFNTDTLAVGGEKTSQRQVVSLQRFEATEIELGVRGYAALNSRVPRNVQFAFSGFNQEDAPGFNVGTGAKGWLMFGRSERVFHEETNPFPSDVTLRVYDQNGQLDMDSSLRYSRHHFDLFVLNGRLNLYVRSGLGVVVNGTLHAAGSTIELQNGDQLVPLEDFRKKLLLQVRFQQTPHRMIENINIDRQPALRGS